MFVVCDCLPLLHQGTYWSCGLLCISVTPSFSATLNYSDVAKTPFLLLLPFLSLLKSSTPLSLLWWLSYGEFALLIKHGSYSFICCIPCLISSVMVEKKDRVGWRCAGASLLLLAIFCVGVSSSLGIPLTRYHAGFCVTFLSKGQWQCLLTSGWDVCCRQGWHGLLSTLRT